LKLIVILILTSILQLIPVSRTGYLEIVGGVGGSEAKGAWVSSQSNLTNLATSYLNASKWCICNAGVGGKLMWFSSLVLEEITWPQLPSRPQIGTVLYLVDNDLNMGISLINKQKVLIKQTVTSPKCWFLCLVEALKAGREQMRQMTQKMLGEPHSTLVFSLIFGSSSPLPADFRHLLKVTGMSHALAVSGFHLTLFLKLNQLWLSRLRSSMLVLIALSLTAATYALIVGLRPPIVRALWMTLHQSLCVRWWHVQYRPLHSLAAFCVVALLYQPTLLESISFQFSVSATAGILILVPVLTKTGWLWQLESGQIFDQQNFDQQNISQKRQIAYGSLAKSLEKSLVQKVASFFREAATISLAAQLSTIPLVLFHFGELSLISILVSTTTAWLIPLLFLSGILLVPIVTLLAALLEPHFAIFLDVVVQLVSAWLWFWGSLLLKILNWFGSWQDALLVVEDFPRWGVLGWWAVLIAFVLIRRKMLGFSNSKNSVDFESDWELALSQLSAQKSIKTPI
jgi:ComEC/Rec2-related protein